LKTKLIQIDQKPNHALELRDRTTQDTNKFHKGRPEGKNNRTEQNRTNQNKNKNNKGKNTTCELLTHIVLNNYHMHFFPIMLYYHSCPIL